MKRKLSNCFIILLLFYVIYEMLTESSLVLESVKYSFNIWQNNIFPSLFPFFVLSDILVYYGFVEVLNELFKNVMYKLFKLNGKCSFVLFMSLISGFPSNAKYTKELYDNDIINEKEATKLLTFTHFSNPLFVIGTISVLFLNNIKCGYLILFCHYLGNFIIGLIFRNYYIKEHNYTKFSLKNMINNLHNYRLNNKHSFGYILTNSIKNSINNLLMILGTVTVFLVITTILNNNLHFSSYIENIINGFIEMTQGLKYISLENISLKLKCVLSVMFISFGGLSVHMQVYSIIVNTKIKYFPYLTARIIHALISSLILYLIFDIYII